MTTRPVAILVMSVESLADVFSSEARTLLESAVTLTGPRPITNFDDAIARAALSEAEVMITGWDAPSIDGTILDEAPRLRAIVHSAGTVKTFLSDEVFSRGVRVTSSAAMNAIPVAEFTVASLVYGLKRANRFTTQLSTTHSPRNITHMPPIGMNGVTVGLVGASRVGREVIRLLREFDVRVLVSDPYLTENEAAFLGVASVTLDDLLEQSDAVSLHAPSNESTQNMIGPAQLGRLHDGAVIVNTARGTLIDTAALTSELVRGRLDAYLDVTDPEPLPGDSPLYRLPNVTLTPHIAGALGNEVHRLGDLAVDEVLRIIEGQPLEHEVLRTDLAQIA